MMKDTAIIKRVLTTLTVNDDFVKSALALPDRIQESLAKIKDLDTFTDFLSRLDGIEAYARRIRADNAVMKAIAISKLLLIGGMRPALERGKPGRGKINPCTATGIFNAHTLSAYRKVGDAADLLPQYRKDVEADQDAEATVQGFLRWERHIRKQVEPDETPRLPEGKFRTIVIDPPWPIQKIDREVTPNQAEFGYPTLSISEIADLPIGNMAGDGCHLYLWTTQKYLPVSFKLLGKWRFKYLVTMVWHKPGGFQPFGLPQYNCEFVVLARRGGLAFQTLKDFPCCFDAKRREHSRKPDEFYDIVRRVSPERRIDMFTREDRDGFESWGSEADKFNVVS